MSRLIAGRRAVREAIRAGTVTRLLVDRSMTRKLEDLLAEANAHGVEVREVGREKLDRRAAREEVRHQGVLAEGPPYPYVGVHDLEGAPLIVALDEISDPHNLGAIVRSAVAFGVPHLMLPERRAAQVTAVAVRASAGATEHATIARVVNLQRALQSLAKAGYRVLGLDADGVDGLEPLRAARAGDPRVLVIGSEGKGLRRMVKERCDQLCRIPQPGPVASFNASVAASIALYEATRE